MAPHDVLASSPSAEDLEWTVLHRSHLVHLYAHLTPTKRWQELARLLQDTPPAS